MKKKVFVANGETFVGEKPRWFRVVFSRPRGYVKERLNNMIMTFEENSA